MKHNAGFTMIEVIVIVAVIAILARVLTPMVVKEIRKSKISRSVSDMETIGTAFAQYYTDSGTWPENYTGAKDVTVDFKSFNCMHKNSQKHANCHGPVRTSSAGS